MEEKKKIVKTPLEQEYQAIESQYRRDVAILENVPKVERVAFGLWAVIDIALLVVFVIGAPLYIVSGNFVDVRSTAGLVRNAVTTHSLSLAQAPASLTLGSAKTLTGAPGAYDFLADASNPNANWYVTFSYSFSFDGGGTEKMPGFLNPSESRPLAQLGIKNDAVPRNARLVIENLAWHRVDRHAVPEITRWLAEHDAFPISAVSTSSIALDHGALGETNFTVANKTAYSYWDPRFLILLERGGSAVSVSEVTLSQFLSDESRPVSVRWFQTIPTGATVRVVPVLNLFDPAVYMKPQS
ncbi:MAG: hypothetical protein WC802_04810 [Patescibacteria group bacterium]|jgi:hypothetical protein